MGDFVAVLDIGKTNKKVCCFDRNFALVEERKREFAAHANDEGLTIEPVAAIWEWFKAELADLHAKYPLAAIGIDSHGAAFALLDESGELVLPVIAYDHHLDDDEQAALDAEFYDLCGPLESLQDETASCDLPLLINPAKALLFLKKHKPEAVQRACHLVNYPQYWSYLLTGVIGAEATYTANHSFLFDPRMRKPSSVAKVLEVDHLVNCHFKDSWDSVGTITDTLQAELGLPEIPVTVGIHDSNAALLPYLLRYSHKDFVLNSTGTWCVAMHKVPAITYAPDELGAKIFYNIDALGQLQKVSFLMGGQDYALYKTLIGGEEPVFDAERLNASLARSDAFIMPGAFPSQFPQCQGGARNGEREWSVNELGAGAGPDWFHQHATAYDLLNASLALQTKVALQRTGVGPQTTIFVEGGFRNNPTYLALLAAAFPQATVASTDLQNATAGGAAILAWAMAETKHPSDYAGVFEIVESPVQTPDLPNFASYADAWFAAV